jgi:hypothetical protein
MVCRVCSINYFGSAKKEGKINTGNINGLPQRKKLHA